MTSCVFAQMTRSCDPAGIDRLHMAAGAQKGPCPQRRLGTGLGQSHRYTMPLALATSRQHLRAPCSQ
jgi:hypothetical protein